MPLRPATDPAKPVIVLFRHDLRLRDNLALSAAAETGKPVVAAFVGDESPAVRRPGAARRWWLHHSLSALSEALAGCGVRLLLRRGTMAAAELVAESGADLVLWNRRYHPAAAAADAAMAADLAAGGIARQDFDGHLLHDPAVLRTGAGEPFKLFTPFWRALTDRVHLRDPAAHLGVHRRLVLVAAAESGCLRVRLGTRLEGWIRRRRGSRVDRVRIALTGARRRDDRPGVRRRLGRGRWLIGCRGRRDGHVLPLPKRDATICPVDAPHVPYPTGGVLAGIWADTAAPAPTTSTSADFA